MTVETVKIVADYREKTSRIPEILIQQGIKVVCHNLTVGDYILPNDYIIERKDAYDFFSSLLSGRLFDQAYRLKEVCSNPILIVEGDFQDVLVSFQRPKALWGALVSLTLRYNLRIFYTGGRDQTAQLLSVIARQSVLTKLGEPIVKERKKLGMKNERQLHVVSSLPGIGLKLSDRLLRKFGSVRAVYKASKRSIAEVEGVGKSKAEKICSLLDAQYKPFNPITEQKCLEETS